MLFAGPRQHGRARPARAPACDEKSQSLFITFGDAVILVCELGPPGAREKGCIAMTDSLWDFAYCHPSHYDELARLADPEDWGQDNRILKSYCQNLFKRAAQLDAQHSQGGPFLCVSDSGHACFNTGLYTERYESIYALFVPNTREGARQPWFLEGFFKESDPALNDVPDLPERVHFTDNPADLVYDYRLKIRLNIDHILGDENNLARIPEQLREPRFQGVLGKLLEGAIQEAKRRVAANYTLAVPQYYNGRIQLLLPICLLGDSPDLALTIQREGGYYAARTCLTIDMAYNNARLITRPEASWITPRES